MQTLRKKKRDKKPFKKNVYKCWKVSIYKALRRYKEIK